jgi:hypothetical protein
MLKRCSMEQLGVPLGDGTSWRSSLLQSLQIEESMRFTHTHSAHTGCILCFILGLDDQDLVLGDPLLQCLAVASHLLVPQTH